MDMRQQQPVRTHFQLENSYIQHLYNKHMKPYVYPEKMLFTEQFDIHIHAVSTMFSSQRENEKSVRCEKKERAAKRARY